MRPNPPRDAFTSLSVPQGPTVVLWLLLVGSVILAVLARRADLAQSSIRHVAMNSPKAN
jgi:hypothetical protein